MPIEARLPCPHEEAVCSYSLPRYRGENREIQPRDHDRTDKHFPYTRMRGKTQHIDPKPSLQPMTIAAFMQLPRVQRVTRVLASKFEI
jgi:hypothetical protein